MEIKGPSAEFWLSIDRFWEVDVDRWPIRMSELWLVAFVYATSCVIELVCHPLLMCWTSTLLLEEIISSISHLKNVCNVLSGYVQYMSVLCSCIAIWVPENTKFV